MFGVRRMVLPLGTALILALLTSALSGRDGSTPPRFDVASVKRNKSGGAPASNFPLGPGNVYVPNGGRFAASGFPLITYIAFAWKIQGNQMQYLLPQLPKWVTSDRFDIEARAAGNSTKDEMRLMMRALLKDRFQLAVHNEQREVPIYALVLVKPGRNGPRLSAHSNDAPCTSEASPPTPGAQQTAPPATPAGLPVYCGGIFTMPPSAPGRTRIAARNVDLALLANALSQMGNIGRPVLDRTGIKGTLDFVFEWDPESAATDGGTSDRDSAALSLVDALRDQLGLKLQAEKNSIEVIVVDRVEYPGEN